MWLKLHSLGHRSCPSALSALNFICIALSRSSYTLLAVHVKESELGGKVDVSNRHFSWMFQSLLLGWQSEQYNSISFQIMQGSGLQESRCSGLFFVLFSDGGFTGSCVFVNDVP